MIGVFDSGIGGSTVLKEMIKVLPKMKYLYYSDSKNNPYGDKSYEEIYLIVKKIVEDFIKRRVDAIVIACNTASALCVKKLREEYPNMIFIAIEPAYKMVYDHNFSGKTLVMATKGTLESEKFLALYHKYDNKKTILYPCVGLAELIENGNDDEICKYLENNIKDFVGVENVVLGCTHYSLIKENIRKVLGDVNFFDGSRGVSLELKRQLELHNLKTENEGLAIEFIDSSGNKNKEKRFWNILNNRIL